MGTNQRSNHCDNPQYCTPWCGIQTQYCHEVRQHLCENKQAVSLVWAVPSPPPSYLDGRRQKKKERGTKGHLMSLSFPLGCGFSHSSFAFLLLRHAKKLKDFFLLKGTKTKIRKAHRKRCSSHTFWILYGHTGHSTLKVWQRN